MKVEFVAYITGHGWGSAGCYNCAEFCNSRHDFIINGGTDLFSKAHPEAGNNDYCMELETTQIDNPFFVDVSSRIRDTYVSSFPAHSFGVT